MDKPRDATSPSLMLLGRVLNEWDAFCRGLELHPGSTAESEMRNVDLALSDLRIHLGATPSETAMPDNVLELAAQVCEARALEWDAAVREGSEQRGYEETVLMECAAKIRSLRTLVSAIATKNAAAPESGESRSTLERAQSGQVAGNDAAITGKRGDSSVSRPDTAVAAPHDKHGDIYARVEAIDAAYDAWLERFDPTGMFATAHGFGRAAWLDASRAFTPSATPMPWIPLSERRPEGDESVLVADIRRNLHCKPSQAVRTAWGWAIKENDACFYTHWQPLPKAPEYVSGKV